MEIPIESTISFGKTFFNKRNSYRDPQNNITRKFSILGLVKIWLHTKHRDKNTYGFDMTFKCVDGKFCQFSKTPDFEIWILRTVYPRNRQIGY